MTIVKTQEVGGSGRRWPRMAAIASLAFGFLATSAAPFGGADAQGETRTISMVHRHTGEQIMVTFRRGGAYDQQALQRLNWFLRDWRRDEPTRMDPTLFDVLWEVYRSVGTTQPIHVVSAYRSPGTNAMLRRRSRGVALHSQHINGRAIDFYIPGVTMSRVREAGMLLQRGGVGFYPGSASQFVHLDTGSVRHWPKVSRDYLARLFPDGRTVHIPADGRPMPGFDVALAMVRARGGTASRFYDSREDESSTFDDDPSSVVRARSTNMGLFAGIFGAQGQREEPRRASVVLAARRAADQPIPTTARSQTPATPVVTTTAPATPAVATPAQQPATTPQPAEQGRPTVVARASNPTQITPVAPRMQIAAVPIPMRAPPAAIRLQGSDDEEEETSLAQAPLPPARPASAGARLVTAVESPQPPQQVVAAAQPNRPTPLPETPVIQAGQPVLAMAPMPLGRPTSVTGAQGPATQVPALIATGDQLGRAHQDETPPGFALAFASPSQPATLPNTPVTGPQPIATAPIVRAAAAAQPQRGAPIGQLRGIARASQGPALVAPSIEGQRGRVALAATRVDRYRGATALSTPDPRQQRLIEMPNLVVANSFSATGATAILPANGFAGQAIAPVRTIEMIALSGTRQRASLDRAN